MRPNPEVLLRVLGTLSVSECHMQLLVLLFTISYVIFVVSSKAIIPVDILSWNFNETYLKRFIYADIKIKLQSTGQYVG